MGIPYLCCLLMSHEPPSLADFIYVSPEQCLLFSPKVSLNLNLAPGTHLLVCCAEPLVSVRSWSGPSCIIRRQVLIRERALSGTAGLMAPLPRVFLARRAGAWSSLLPHGPRVLVSQLHSIPGAGPCFSPTPRRTLWEGGSQPWAVWERACLTKE